MFSKITNLNYEHVFARHLSNILNHKPERDCFQVIGSRHDSVKKLEELILNLSLQAGENVLADSDYIFMEYFNLVSSLYGDSNAEIKSNDLEQQVYSQLNKAG